MAGTLTNCAPTRPGQACCSGQRHGTRTQVCRSALHVQLWPVVLRDLDSTGDPDSNPVRRKHVPEHATGCCQARCSLTLNVGVCGIQLMTCPLFGSGIRRPFSSTATATPGGGHRGAQTTTTRTHHTLCHRSMCACVCACRRLCGACSTLSACGARHAARRLTRGGTVSATATSVTTISCGGAARRFHKQAGMLSPCRFVVNSASSGILPPSPHAGTVQANVLSVSAATIFDSRNFFASSLPFFR